MEMGRLNSVSEYQPASRDLRGLHTSPSVSEEMKKTASRSPKSQCSQRERKQAASVGMLKGQERDRRGGGERTLQLSCTHRKGAEGCAGEQAGAEQAVIFPREGNGTDFDSGLWSLVSCREACLLSHLPAAC